MVATVRALAALCLLIGVFVSPADAKRCDAVASLDHDQLCHLTGPARAARDRRTAALLRRLYLAGGEAMDHPAFYVKVERQTRRALAEMRARYGAPCVITLRQFGPLQCLLADCRRR